MVAVFAAGFHVVISYVVAVAVFGNLPRYIHRRILPDSPAVFVTPVFCYLVEPVCYVAAVKS